jgi:N-acetylglucosamine-6-sulfatase
MCHSDRAVVLHLCMREDKVTISVMDKFKRAAEQLGSLGKRNLIGFLVVAVVMVGGYILLQARAATPAFSLEPENGAATGPISVGHDASVSGGGFIKFTGASTAKMNIVYILTDDQTMESVAKMPYVSSRTDWIKFDKAYINNGLCCPSRATILTGQYDTHTGVGNNAQGARLNENETLPVWLRRAGYQTGLFGKYLNQYPFGRGNYIPAGWSDWQVAYSDGPQWQLYPQYHWKLNSNGTSVSYLNAPQDYQVSVLTTKMTNFISAKAAAGQPFFAEFTPSATHSPWQASPSRAGTMANAPVTRNPNFNYVAANQPAYLKAQTPWDGPTMDAERRKEWEGAASVDDAVRQIDTALRAAGVFDNTIMIFMTDNGYAFGNHRWERKRCEFNECGQTPLYVRYPGVAAHPDSHMITNVDMAATISDLAGATPVIPQDGMSFAALIRGPGIEVGAWRNSILLHWPGGDMEGRPGQPDSMPQFWGVLATTADGGYWKYVEIDTGEKELYNEVLDPNEMNNVAGNAGNASRVAELKSMLNTLKAKAQGTAGASPLRADVPTSGTLGPDLD